MTKHIAKFILSIHCTDACFNPLQNVILMMMFFIVLKLDHLQRIMLSI